jgi:hypothetical protein
LTRATVGVETKIAGDVCLDDEKHGHGHHETAIDAGPGGERSVLPTRIDLRIAVKSPNSYSDAKNRCSSGECRFNRIFRWCGDWKLAAPPPRGTGRWIAGPWPPRSKPWQIAFDSSARCASTPLHDFAHHTTVFRGHPARRPACRDAQSIATAGQRRRGAQKTALRVAFPVPPGRRERLPMGPHRRRVPSCRGNGKRDRMIREIVQGSTGVADNRKESSGKRSLERHDRLRQGGPPIKSRDLVRSRCGGNWNSPWPHKGIIWNDWCLAPLNRPVPAGGGNNTATDTNL